MKKSKSWILLIAAFFLLLNYCGLHATGGYASEPKNIDRAHQHDSNHLFRSDEMGQGSHAPSENHSCCAEMYCCTSLKGRGTIQELFHRSWNPLRERAALTFENAVIDENELNHAFVWAHDVGPPTFLVKTPFSILEYPSHAPPLP